MFSVREMIGNLGNRQVAAATAVVCAALALGLLAAQDSAGAGTELRYYEGRAANDQNSHLEFDAVMGRTRIVKVVRFSYQRFDVDCKFGEDETVGFAFTRPFKVGPLRKFKGTERVRYGKLVVTTKVRGHFNSKLGAAVGRLRVSALGDTCVARWRVDEKEVKTP